MLPYDLKNGASERTPLPVLLMDIGLALLGGIAAVGASLGAIFVVMGLE